MENQTSMNDLSIIVLHWKNKALTQSTINRLLEWQIIQPKIILVQNETTDDLFPEFQNVQKLFSETNKGYGGGNNLGLQLAMSQSKYSLLLNTDATVTEDAVITLVGLMKTHKGFFSIGPMIVEKQEDKTIHYYGGKDISSNLNTRISELDVNHPIAKAYLEVDYTIGTILLLDNKKLSKVGLFDENYFFSGEVADLCYRAKADCGYKSVTALNCKGHHTLHDQSLRKTMYKYYNLRNRLLFCKKHKKGIFMSMKWYIFIAKDTLYWALKLNSNQVKANIHCIKDVILGKFGNANHYFIKAQ